MKISISNIALKKYPFVEGLKAIKKLSLDGIEVAPSLLFVDPLASGKTEREEAQKIIEDHGICVVGLHSLFYNQPQMQILSKETQPACLDQLKGMAELCVDLGGKILSFGAPKNRLKGHLEFEDAFVLAVDFFRRAAESVAALGVTICFEPLSPVYHCDFIKDLNEGADLVKAVGHSHFQMLLDTGNMVLNGEDPTQSYLQHKGVMGHVHINDPQLKAPTEKDMDHALFAKALNTQIRIERNLKRRPNDQHE